MTYATEAVGPLFEKRSSESPCDAVPLSEMFREEMDSLRKENVRLHAQAIRARLELEGAIAELSLPDGGRPHFWARSASRAYTELRKLRKVYVAARGVTDIIDERPRMRSLLNRPDACRLDVAAAKLFDALDEYEKGR